MALTREELGRRIACERERAGLTQGQLAERIGLDRSAITRIERGRQGIDTLRLSAVAEALGRPPAVFFSEQTAEEPLELLLSAPEAADADVRQQVAWLRTFLHDYMFLRSLDAELAGS